MSNWRPSKWKKPYIGKVGGDLDSVFEAGADAMLEVLKKPGKYYNDVKAPYKTIGVLREIKEPGWLIFIPDKEGK